MWINFIANLQHLDWNRKKLASFLQPYNFYRELLRTFYSLKKLFQSMNFNTTSIEDFVPWASFGYFLGRNARSLGKIQSFLGQDKHSLMVVEHEELPHLGKSIEALRINR